MAIYIQLKRIEETEQLVVYEFGPVDRFIGQIAFDKETGDLILVDFLADARQRSEFYLSRIRRVMEKCRAEGNYPEFTHYAA